MTKRLSEKQKEEILEKYKNKEQTCSSLAREYGFRAQSINKFLRKNNVVIRGLDTTQRKYILNEHYFDQIDTEEKAYFLGLLYADGCNSQQNNTIKISLQEEDKEILERFNVAINSNRPLKYISNLKKKDAKRKPQWLLCLSSKHLSNQLSILGCHPNKTHTLIFPTEQQVPKFLLIHWLRGLWDGDGSFSFWKTKYKTKKETKYINAYCINLVGTESLCNNVKIYLMDTFGIDSGVYNIKGKLSKRLKIKRHENMISIIDLFYNNSSLFLNRKYKKAIEIKTKIGMI